MRHKTNWAKRLKNSWAHLRGKSPNLNITELHRLAQYMQKHGPVNQYDGANTGRTRADWSTNYTEPYYDLAQLKILINRSRELAKSDGLYKNAIRTLVDNVIGTGLRAKPAVVDAEGKRMSDINDQLESAWSQWVMRNNWDAMQKQPFEGAGQRMIYRTRLVSGNVFLNTVMDTARYIPLVFQTFELDRLDDSQDDFVRNQYNAEQVRQTISGINLNDIGTPVSYWIKGISKAITASNIIHGYTMLRPEQYIGEPMGGPVLDDFYDTRELGDDYLLKSRAIAKLAWWLSDTDSFADGSETNEDGTAVLEANLGLLRTNTKPEKMAMPDDVSKTLEPLLRLKKHDALSGMGTSYTTVTRDLSGVNFAASKFIDIAEWRFYSPERADIVGDVFQPMYDRFVLWAVASGKIKGLDAAQYQQHQSQYNRAHWAGDEREDVDPLKTAKTHELNLKHNIETLESILRKKGKTLKDHFQELQDIQKTATKFGIDIAPSAKRVQDGTADRADIETINATLESIIDQLEKNNDG